jgi:hypothetical protein
VPAGGQVAGALAYVGIAPIFAGFIAIAIASLIEQRLTHAPGRLIRAVTRCPA